MNGAVETDNSIKKVMQKMIVTYKDWHEMLPFALYGYRTSIYQKRMTQEFNKRVKRQVYRIGDLVIKRIILPQGDPRGKWIPTYEGPFVVKKVFSGGAMILATMDGEDFPHPVNANIVKKYYA
ncbi:hypothetical protein KIW84_032078 [Lathyrus oleraceus]|uniref:Uncharacterized protein n=1 Tax=Pisum sativum TaxID=3888 RepID=A0A9D5B171_PEA|nr:hypothetical protein KIW84_032078 [Pisum sativum]